MSAPRVFDLVVVGSGPGGQKAAIQGAKAGKRVAVVEAARRVGGACVHYGTIPSKTLREIAVRLRPFRDEDSPFTLRTRRPVELSLLLRSLDKIVGAHDDYIEDQLLRNGVSLIHGRARLTSRFTAQVQHVDGTESTLAADVFVLATGSRPRSPEGIPVDHEHVLDSDSVLSLNYLPESLIVLGGGVIATEYAAIFSALGAEVTLVDRAQRPLGFLDPELVDRFLESYVAAGGRVLGERRAESVCFDGLSKVLVGLDDGTELAAEKVLVAMGRVANVEGLGIEQAGLSVTGRGLIEVDDDGRTAVENIFAVGDVVGWPSLASSAMEQGRRAVCAAFGLTPPREMERIPIGIYSIPEMASVGLGEAEARAAVGEPLIGRARFDEVARGHISGAVDGLLKMVADPEGRKLLGVAIVGEGATELIHIAQMALVSGAEIDLFVENVFNFPTLAEGYRVAALDILGQRARRAAAAGRAVS